MRRKKALGGPPDPARGRALDLEAYLDIEERSGGADAYKRNLRRLLLEIWVQRGPLLAGGAAILLGTAAALLEPRIFGYAIDEAIVPKDWLKLQKIGIAFLFVVCLRVAAVIAQGMLFESLGQRVTHSLRCRLFTHLQRMPVSVFDRNPAGRLMTRVTNDIESLSEMFSAGFVSMVGNVLLVFGILGWLLFLDLKLGLIAASVFPVLTWLSIYFTRRLRVAYRESRSRLSAVNAFLAENFLGMKVLHLFSRASLHLERFDRLNQWYAEAQFGTVRVYALFQPAITLASGIAIALVIWFGGIGALEGSIKLGVLVAYFSYVLTLFQPMREIADKWNVFLSGLASAERVYSILDWDPEMTNEEASRPVPRLEGIRGHIVFENVWFAYDTRSAGDGEPHWVLKDFSVEIPAGSRVGVVGHTGAGKTTLISLLMRFYEPQKGRILLDGKDLRDYDKRALRAAFGIVQQDVFLFSGSMADNVSFWQGRPETALPPELLAVDSSLELNERGGNLSMGQRQMLAFARVLESGPQMWILDEATANMDSESEEKLQRALEEASRGRTSILIAHRLATVRSANQILVLHKGSLIERGAHDDLVKLDGLYARLYRYQRAQSERERIESDGRFTSPSG